MMRSRHFSIRSDHPRDLLRSAVLSTGDGACHGACIWRTTSLESMDWVEIQKAERPLSITSSISFDTPHCRPHLADASSLEVDTRSLGESAAAGGSRKEAIGII